MLAVVEAKAAYKKSRDGLQQAKEHAQFLDLQFAYATTGLPRPGFRGALPKGERGNE